MLNESVGAEMESIRISVPEGKTRTKSKPAEYDRAYYVAEHGEAAAAEFLDAVGVVKSIVSRNGWNLTPAPTKYYYGFKAGNYRPLAVQWSGKTNWVVQIKMPENEARAAQIPGWEVQRYDATWSQAIFRRTSDTANVSALEPLFRQSWVKWGHG